MKTEHFLSVLIIGLIALFVMTVKLHQGDGEEHLSICETMQLGEGECCISNNGTFYGECVTRTTVWMELTLTNDGDVPISVGVPEISNELNISHPWITTNPVRYAKGSERMEWNCCYPWNCPEAVNNPEDCNCLYMVQCLSEEEYRKMIEPKSGPLSHQIYEVNITPLYRYNKGAEK